MKLNSLIVCELGKMAHPVGEGTHKYDRHSDMRFEFIMNKWFLPELVDSIEFLGDTIELCVPGTHGIVARLMQGQKYKVALVITPFIFLTPPKSKKFQQPRGEVLVERSDFIPNPLEKKCTAIAQHLGLWAKARGVNDPQPVLFYPKVDYPLDRYVIRLFPYNILDDLKENDVRQKAAELAHIISEVYSLKED